MADSINLYIYEEFESGYYDHNSWFKLENEKIYKEFIDNNKSDLISIIKNKQKLKLTELLKKYNIVPNNNIYLYEIILELDQIEIYVYYNDIKLPEVRSSLVLNIE